MKNTVISQERNILNSILAERLTPSIGNMNDVCRFSRDHVVECSERTVLSCLEPVCLCWRRFGRYFSHIWPDDGKSISRNVANINKLVQEKIKLFFQNILQHHR